MKIKPHSYVPLTVLILALATSAFAVGPYSPTNWPPTINTNKVVHYNVTDAYPFILPSSTWSNTLFYATAASDSVVSPQQSCGPLVTFTGNKATATFINIGDTEYTFWNTQPQIDILIQVYGDTAMLTNGMGPGTRTWRFREGNVNYTNVAGTGTAANKSVNATAIPTNNLPNFKWNWVLITITNEPIIKDGSPTGNRWVGTFAQPPSTGNHTYGGINGGTLRSQPQQSPGNSWNGLQVHAIAFGEAGAFGDPADVNVFEPADVVVGCDPVPNENLVGIDINAGVTNYLQVMNDLDQTVAYTNSVGPGGDLRNAVFPTGNYLNFGILSNRLGQPCNPNVAVKVCVDFYDDPLLVGTLFGPESYAADKFGGSCGANVLVPTPSLHTLAGTGKWIRKSWTFPSVNLYGVNVTPLTGGPRFVATGPVAVSRFELAALRASGPLVGLDPLASCLQDPLVCEGVYSNYVEWNGDGPVVNGLQPGTSGTGDQQYTNEMAGPAGDQRMSVRNIDGAASKFLNFAFVGDGLGPVTQGNVKLGIAVTYWDDPALAGKGLRAQTWRYESLGNPQLQGSLSAPQDNIILQGSNTWREAYWQIDRINFNGVNQSPAATRFECEFGADNTKKIHISRVRYAVIRDCGASAGVNLLATNVPALTSAQLGAALSPDGLTTKVSWPYRAPQALLERSLDLTDTNGWGNQPFYDPAVATIEGGETRVFSVTNSSSTNRFFRLRIPKVP